MKKKAAKETSGQSSSSTKKKATKEVGDSPAATVGKTQTMQLKPLSVRAYGTNIERSKADTRTIPGITQTSPRHPARRRVMKSAVMKKAWNETTHHTS
ncbi:hypothetical protein PF008_g25561 [Phytophthora fragariae]|uniref:Uncharacterized protein n=1 Tax=Phytophthora fragariae TaxID=53985 RepID=A0A6G0QJL0_9STRA|nr:hypothetical protein PF008_g25561 [Phytophthora fragariae]